MGCNGISPSGQQQTVIDYYGLDQYGWIFILVVLDSCASVHLLENYFCHQALKEETTITIVKQRAEIGKYASKNSTVAAVRKYSKQLEKGIDESTIPGFKKAYEV